MFEIHMSKPDLNNGRWFCIWSSKDGAGTAQYLKELCTEPERSRQGREYRMVYEPQSIFLSLKRSGSVTNYRCDRTLCGYAWDADKTSKQPVCPQCKEGYGNATR